MHDDNDYVLASARTASPTAFLVKKAVLHSTDWWDWIRAADVAHDRGSNEWVTDPFTSG